MGAMSPHRVVLTALIGATLIMATALLVWPVRAHEAPTGFKFSPWCCNGNSVHGDCAQIPASAVEEVSGGYQITLKPGDHHMVTKVHGAASPQLSRKPAGAASSRP